ncbi:MAG: replicative helicase loader/inhibitor [Elusimicrobiales bacterium]|nr:replicative helicase loader/inhibitor [Elusimicrobiales bacterium]
MNRSDVLKIMAVLRGAYPQFYRGISRQEAEDTVNLWTDEFSADDPRLVGAAVKLFISGDEHGFPPVIGQIRAKMRLLTSSDEMTAMDAWGIVSKALRNGLYGSAEEFEKFPPIIKRIVGSSSMLREWAMMDTDTVHSVVASNFQRSYKAISSREKELAKLPPDVKDLVQGLNFAKDPQRLDGGGK